MDQRITLDGTLAEAVDAKAKDLAVQRPAKLAGRNAAKHVAKTTASEAVKPKLAAHATCRDQRARVGASLLRRSA
jgi:hypothetical protein